METMKQYNLEKVIGQGAFSKVIICTHKFTGRKAAIKVVDRKGLNGEEELRCIERERLIAPLLKHPNIVRTTNVVELGRYFQFFMEYCPNGDLLSYVKNSTVGRLSEDEARRMFIGVLGALDYLHRNGIVHRDVKLENVLLDENMEPKLADFGFATRYNTYGFSKLTEYCGTISYSAPEICGGVPYVGPEVDIWSLGVLLYAMVAGHLPFSGPDGPTVTHRIKSAQVVYPAHFSRELIELLRDIFQVNGKHRPTAKRVLNYAWIQEAEEAEELSKIYEDNNLACEDTPRTRKTQDDEDSQTSRSDHSAASEKTKSKSWGNLPDMSSELPFPTEANSPVNLLLHEKISPNKQKVPSPTEDRSSHLSVTATILDHLGATHSGNRKHSIGERPDKTAEEIDQEGAGERVCSPKSMSRIVSSKVSSGSPTTTKKNKSGSSIVRRPSFFSQKSNNTVIERTASEDTNSPITSRPRSNSVETKQPAHSEIRTLEKCATVLHLKKDEKKEHPSPLHASLSREEAKIAASPDKEEKEKPKKQRKKGSMIAFLTGDKTSEPSPRSRPLSLTLPKHPAELFHEENAQKRDSPPGISSSGGGSSSSSSSGSSSSSSSSNGSMNYSPDVFRKEGPKLSPEENNNNQKKTEREKLKEKMRERSSSQSSERKSLSKWINSIF